MIGVPSCSASLIVAPSGKRVPGPVVHVDARPAQLLGSAAGFGRPDPDRVVEDPVAVGVLLDDHHQRVVVEAQWDVVPPEPLDRLGDSTAGRRGLAHGPDAPGTVPGADPAVGVHGSGGAVHTELTLPGADLGEALSVEDDAPARTPPVRDLVHRRKRTPPLEIEPDPVVVSVADEPDALQGLDDLHAEGADSGTHRVLVVEGVRRPHGELTVPGADGGVGVDHAEVRVQAESEHHHRVAAAAVGVEVAAVVSVRIRAHHLAHGEWCLMDRELIERVRHRDLHDRAGGACPGSDGPSNSAEEVRPPWGEP